MKLRLAAAVALSALLTAGSTARAQQVEGETLTTEERRGAGEFLLRLDERWREARDFDALFDEAFVGDFVENSGAGTFLLSFLEEPLRDQLSAAERRRATLLGLDFIYVAGRLNLTFELREKKSKAERKLNNAPAEKPDAIGSSREPESEGGAESEDEGGDEPSLEEKLSPAVMEAFRGSPLGAAFVEEEDGKADGGGEPTKIETREQFYELIETFERVMPKLRARVKELEAELPGGPPSAVSREDEDEGESPDLKLTILSNEWLNRSAGTRVVCGYVSSLHVDLVEEGGRYKVLAAYTED
jgi:hypothetical protein